MNIFPHRLAIFAMIDHIVYLNYNESQIIASDVSKRLQDPNFCGTFEKDTKGKNNNEK